MLLADAINLFLGEYKPTTQATYRYELNRMAGFVGPRRQLKEITPALLTEYNQSLRSRDYAPATVCKHVKTIKSFFNWCVRLELLDHSPAKTLRTVRLPSYVNRDKAMTDEELNAILEYVRWKPRDYALILFLADTGCRAGGAMSLTINNLHLDQNRAIVIEKGDKEHLVSFGSLCANVLHSWLLKRKGDKGPYVFSRDGRKLTRRSISQVLRRACLAVGIRSLGPHSLRHRKGHQFADAHIAASIAATALGHSDPTITLRHYYPADWASAEAALQEFATKKSAEPNKILKLPPRTAG